MAPVTFGCRQTLHRLRGSGTTRSSFDHHLVPPRCIAVTRDRDTRPKNIRGNQPQFQIRTEIAVNLTGALAIG